MPTYVALIRGIMPQNPNMRNEKLCAVLESIGLEKTRAVQTSGNVIFETARTGQAKLEAEIEAAFNAQLGIPGKTLVRSKADLEKLVKADPFKGVPHTKSTYLNVTFLKSEPAETPKYPLHPGAGCTVLGQADRAVFSIRDADQTGGPELMKWLEKTFSKDITNRIWAAIHRILAKM
jgi:uncharacterized protein (DUF1697 family)